MASFQVTEVQKSLKGFDYPGSADDLAEHARGNGADEELVNALRGLDKDAFRATFATNFLIDGGVRLVAYAVAGLFGFATLTWVGAALPLVAAGLYIGGRIHVNMTQKNFVRLVSLILIASGMALLIRG